jgi:acetoacetate decarboxylase
MKIDDVRRIAHSMPLTSPSFSAGALSIFQPGILRHHYRTDPEALAAVVPEPLEVAIIWRSSRRSRQKA